MSTLPLDTETAAEDSEIFAASLINTYNQGAIAAMISIGHQLGIFDHMARLKPASSEAIAQSCELHERYVREWLAVMVTGHIVDYNPKEKTYHLPQYRAACLTRAASPENFAVTSQFIPLISQMVPKLLECFKNGGGLQYCEYPNFHAVMAEDSQQTVVDGLFDVVLPLVPGLKQKLQAGIKVLDAGCGAGRALFQMAQAFPNSQFFGYDLCADAFCDTQEKARTQRLTNLHFESRDLGNFSERNEYDLITTFDAVHDQAKPAAFLAAIHAALKPDGMYLMQDIAGSSHLENNLDHPLAPLLYSISTAHCMPVSLGQGGEGLGTMWGEELALQLLTEVGFKKIETHHLEHDPFNIYFVSQR